MRLLAAQASYHFGGFVRIQFGSSCPSWICAEHLDPRPCRADYSSRSIHTARFSDHLVQAHLAQPVQCGVDLKQRSQRPHEWLGGAGAQVPMVVLAWLLLLLLPALPLQQPLMPAALAAAAPQLCLYSAAELCHAAEQLLGSRGVCSCSFSLQLSTQAILVG